MNTWYTINYSDNKDVQTNIKYRRRVDAVEHLLSKGYEPTEYLSDEYVIIDEDGFTDRRAEIEQWDDTYRRQMAREYA